MFSGEFCEISRNTFFTKHLWTTASDSRRSRLQMLLKIGVLEALLRKTCRLKAGNFVKKKVFSCEVCENFKNSFFTEHLRWMLLHIRWLHLYFFEKAIKQLFRSLVMTYYFFLFDMSFVEQKSNSFVVRFSK